MVEGRTMQVRRGWRLSILLSQSHIPVRFPSKKGMGCFEYCLPNTEQAVGAARWHYRSRDHHPQCSERVCDPAIPASSRSCGLRFAVHLSLVTYLQEPALCYVRNTLPASSQRSSVWYTDCRYGRRQQVASRRTYAIVP